MAKSEHAPIILHASVLHDTFSMTIL